MRGKMSKEQIQVSLKRNVILNVEITESFKNNLIKELDDNSSLAQSKLKELDQQLKLVNLNDQSGIKSELDKLAQLLNQVPQQKESIQKMAVGAVFQQGVIEGTVTVKIGDNLYEKLNNLEILIKDGVIIDIKYSNKKA